MIPKAKKQKIKKPTDEETRKIMAASWVVTSATGIYLGLEYGWREVRMNKLINGYWAAMKEIHSINSNRIIHQDKPWGITEYEVLEMAQPYAGVNLHTVFAGRMKSDPYKRWINNLVMCAMILTLNTLNGWSKQRIDRWLEGYTALVDEVHNPRQSTGVNDLLKWCEEVTGVNIKKVLV